jgi:CBS domain containing-hemolysin-like protein
LTGVTKFSAAWRIGSPRFAAILFLASLSAGLAWILLPVLFFALGSGGVVPMLICVITFVIILIFKAYIFRHIYHQKSSDGETALLEYLVQQNAGGTPGEEEVEMELLENALHLKQVRVRDCMTPRVDIVHIDVGQPILELQQLFVESSMSRILVTDGDLDKVLGYVHVQQIFSQPRYIGDIVMPIAFVPSSISVDHLLHKFIKNRTNIACVVNEYGELAGIVTLEDVLEQLFGKIYDEHDQEEFIEVQPAEGEYLFSGRLKVDYLNQKYPELRIPSGAYSTLSGYIVMSTHHLPEQGAIIEMNGYRYTLELVSDRKIETVRVNQLYPPA